MPRCEMEYTCRSQENREPSERIAMSNNDDAREIPFPPSGERVSVRGQRRKLPQYGKHRTRTSAGRDFARQLRNKSTDAEKRLWRLLRDNRFSDFKFRRQYPCGIYFLDFVLAFWMVHEVANAVALFAEMHEALNANGKLLLVEPKLHVARR